MLLSSAKIDALIHAARDGCAPAMPVVQPDIINALMPPGILAVECPGGCGASLPVPLLITGAPSASADDDEPCARWTAEAADLHDRIYMHLRTCPSARTWVDTALHEAIPPRPTHRIG